MFCFLKVRWENLTTFCETRPSRHRVSILSEKGCTAHDARRERPVTHGPAWEQYAFIQNKINRLVTKSQNRVSSPCKRWDTPREIIQIFAFFLHYCREANTQEEQGSAQKWAPATKSTSTLLSDLRTTLTAPITWRGLPFGDRKRPMPGLNIAF